MLTHLFQPLTLRAGRLRNRIVSTGHDTVMIDEGKVTDQLVAYHRARAQGGVGLIVVQVGGVHPTARYTSHALMADSDACIPGYARIAGVAHEFGAQVYGQLFHGGREVMDTADGSRSVSLSASAVPNERFRVVPRAMAHELVTEVVDSFGRAAHRLEEAGLDGAEIVASHGYLPAQFLNPRVNLRGDDFGGSFDNRLRFLREALVSARERTSERFTIGVRMSLGEEGPDGLDPEEALEALAALDGLGLLDYVSVVRGSSATLAGSDHIAPAMAWAAGYVAPLGRRVKEAVRVPVIVAGRINQPQDGDLIIARGDADAVGMTRALICDPRLPELAQAGRLDDIRACIGCNQACIGHFHSGHPISCIQRPETGRELTHGTPALAPVRRRVMVVGGGPAGLKAAVVAARRGHEVSVHEAQARLGGQVLLAELLPGRSEFGGAITNLQNEIDRHGVRVHTRSRVDLALLHRERPDVVVVATGAIPYRPEFELTDEAHVLDAAQVLRGTRPPAGRTLVVDTPGDWVGIGVATLICENGGRATLSTTGYQAGEALQQYVRDEMLKRMIRAGVETLPLCRLYGADEDTAYLQHVLTEEPVILPGITSIVLSLGHTPDTGIEELLLAMPAAERPEMHLAGDCLAPRTVEEAILEGMRVGHTI